MDTAIAAIAAFIAAAALLTVTPGPDNALMLRTAAAEGTRPAFAAAFGISLGCVSWALLTALGLSALLAASETAYTVLKWVGAAYLFWIGGRMLLKPRESFDLGEADKAAAKGDAGPFLRGLLTNLLNPKVGIFYVSFLPQFIPHDAPVAVWTAMLGVVHALVGMIWFLCLIAATRPLANALRKAAVIRWLDRVTGGVFLAFGVRLALESRR